ncbi:uncharacterized protein Dvar_02670 [Desulfosarcina variabilis str. Montpellier]
MNLEKIMCMSKDAFELFTPLDYCPPGETGKCVFLACREDALQEIVNDLGWQPRNRPG